jgi:hypothetical protein
MFPKSNSTNFNRDKNHGPRASPARTSSLARSNARRNRREEILTTLACSCTRPPGQITILKTNRFRRAPSPRGESRGEGQPPCPSSPLDSFPKFQTQSSVLNPQHFCLPPEFDPAPTTSSKSNSANLTAPKNLGTARQSGSDLRPRPFKSIVGIDMRNPEPPRRIYPRPHR